MANIKFSQFTVGNVQSDIDFVVGYKGGDNIQISPANLLSATLTGYLPLTGGTMTGTSGIDMPDNFALKAGNSQDLQIYHDSSNSIIDNSSGHLFIRNSKVDRDIIFQADDGTGVATTTYFKVDGGAEIVVASKEFRFLDNVPVKLGTGPDFQMLHNGTTTSIENSTGNLLITNFADDSDIIFKSDDGSGGVTTYFYLDGSGAITRVSRNFRTDDSIRFQAGSSGDLNIYHDGTHSYIGNDTGNLYIQQLSDDSDIVFQSDDGAGGVTDYLRIDGSTTTIVPFKDMTFGDSVKATFGVGSDLKILHDATDSYIQNFTGDLKIFQNADDKDITFYNDDGLGGTTAYFYLDGSLELNRFLKSTLYNDNIRASFGASSDLQIQHSGTDSFIENNTGNLFISNFANDKDIRFATDDGSGGTATYFFLDGSTASGGSLYTQFPDSSNLTFGADNDLRIYHNGTNSNIENFNGTLQFVQNLNDGDINFLCDDGAGGVTTYLFLDGSNKRMQFNTDFITGDNNKIVFGNGGDFAQFHDGTNTYLSNGTGDFYIRNQADDKDIVFQSDDGSGGNTTYFQLDGSHNKMIAYKDIHFEDNIKARFGSYATADLEIYHDGSNSYIDDTGTGWIKIRGNGGVLLESYSEGETMIKASRDGSVELYHNNNKKFETTSTGVKITGISEYADNTAAIAGGLTTGDVYRTGDLLKIVH